MFTNMVGLVARDQCCFLTSDEAAKLPYSLHFANAENLRKSNFRNHYFTIPGLFQSCPGPMPFSSTFRAWKTQHVNSRTIQGLYEPCLHQVLADCCLA